MFTLIAENQYNERLELTHNPAYTITEIDGIDPPDAIINTTHNAGADGSEFNSAYVNNRQITITLVVNAPAEVNRINLYKYFKSKFPVRLYYTNSTRDVYIDGYVQNMTVGYFDKKQTVQIVVMCPKPYFNGAMDSVQEFVTITPLFEFPFDIAAVNNKNFLFNNVGSLSVGGVDFTLNEDDTVTANGTASDYTWTAYINQSLTLPAGSYILSGCPAGGSSTTYRLQAFAGDVSNPTLTVNDYGNGASFTLSAETTLTVRMLIKGTVNNILFSPMIRLSTAAAGYVPYGYTGGIPFSELLLGVERDIVNNGDVVTGVIITIQATGQVVNPKIYNVETRESFILNTTLQDGDLVTINTRQSEKAITLLRNGVTSNLIGSLEQGSTWFKLIPGDNIFTTAADATPENMIVTFTVTDQYEGV